jgi:protein-S-isoprenylcysteine O-methyltransferase Ste14
MPDNWPALILGLILGTYWARVLRLAMKARRRTGQLGNLLPREAIGRVLRVIRYPTVVAWIVLPFVAARWRPAPLLSFLYDIPWLAWLGVGIALAALCATWICWKRMGKSWRMGINPAEKTQLIVTGPYAYVRHPIYALSSLLMLASVVVVPTIAMIVVAIIHLVLLQWEARREEAHMLAQHGAAYADYRAKVGRFLPRSLRAYAAATT